MKGNRSTPSLSTFLDLAKRELMNANDNRNYAFRTMVMSTKSDFTHSRMVIKRETNSDMSSFVYTDARSKKVEQLRKDDRCSLLFYDPANHFQVVVQGRCNIIDEGSLYLKHQKIALQNRKDYNAEKPSGTKIDLPYYQHGNYTYFSLLKISPVAIELLKLGKLRHLRARYLADEDWSGTWLVP